MVGVVINVLRNKFLKTIQPFIIGEIKRSAGVKTGKLVTFYDFTDFTINYKGFKEILDGLIVRLVNRVHL